MKPFNNAAEYQLAMKTILQLMNKGESNLKEKERNDLKKLAAKAQAYEQKIYPVEMPKTFQGMIELKMYERKLKKQDLAKKLHISNAKLSLILSGKQKPDVKFIKGVHKELDIDGNEILEYV
jgi:HTH-type transcriptional regulator/antitoxin HigA